MAEVNRITVEDFEKVIEDVSMIETPINWNGLELIVKRNISLEDMIGYVSSVSELCFEDETNRYMPELKDFGIRLYLINYYTNIDLPESTSKKYEFIYNTDIVQTVLNAVDPQQFNEIVQSIENKVEYMSSANIEAIQKHMIEISNAIEEFGKLFEAMFDDMDAESVQKLVSSITDGAIDESKLVEAYIEQTKNNSAE